MLVSSGPVRDISNCLRDRSKPGVARGTHAQIEFQQAWKTPTVDVSRAAQGDGPAHNIINTLIINILGRKTCVGILWRFLRLVRP